MNKVGKIESEKIINEFEIQKEYLYYKPKFSNLCKIEDIGLESFVVCLTKNPKRCIFSLPFGNMYFCKSPLLVHSAKGKKIKRQSS
jgi:hypothetical protein